MGRELRKSGKKDTPCPDIFKKLSVILRDHRIPPQIEEQFVLFQIIGRRLNRHLIKISIGSPRKEKSAAVKTLTQRLGACPRHKDIKDLTALFRLPMPPLRRIVAETSPDRVIGSLFAIADESVERSRITPLKKSDAALHFAFAGMGFDKLEKLPCHIPFALGQRVIPRLTLLFEKHKERVLFIDHIGAHHPGLEK